MLHRSSVSGLEETRTCIASIHDLSAALEDEAKERVALELSVHQAFQVMQADFEHEVEQTHLVKDWKCSLDRDLALLNDKCAEQEKLTGQLKELLEAVQHERGGQKDFDQMKIDLVELQKGIKGVSEHVRGETNQMLSSERKERKVHFEEAEGAFRQPAIVDLRGAVKETTNYYAHVLTFLL